MGILGPLISARLERGDLQEYFEEQARRVFEGPDGRLVTVTAKTLERWLYAYRRGGVKALEPRVRRDAGASRAIGAELAELVLKMKRDNPRRSIEQIIDALVRARKARRGELRRSSVHRLLRAANLSIRPPRDAPRERRAFLPRHASDLWLGDAMHGPLVIAPNGKPHKSYLLTQFDAATRYVPHSEFFLSEDARHHELGLRSALERHGLPRTYYVDRGAAYIADSLRTICADLGIHLVHTRPRDCQAKGAIERWHRTWRDEVEIELPTEPLPLHELNARHWAWLAERYHRRVHTTTGQAPLSHWLSELDHLRPGPGAAALDEVFLHRVERKVRRDGTVRWQGGHCEVPYELVGQTIELRFDPMHPYEPPRVYVEGRFLERAAALDRRRNSDGRRRKLAQETPDVTAPPGIDPLDLLMRDWDRSIAGLVADRDDEPDDDEHDDSEEDAA